MVRRKPPDWCLVRTLPFIFLAHVLSCTFGIKCWKINTQVQLKITLGGPRRKPGVASARSPSHLLPNSSEKKTFTDSFYGNDTALSLSRGDH